MTERTSQIRIPTGQELADSVQLYFEKYWKKALMENERWRQRSRKARVVACSPGGCPKPGDWPKPKFDTYED